jgi:mannose-6-phosphate isomerase
MKPPSPQPVVFEPLFKPKPWGGRGLERLGKSLPQGSIGESWELVSLPGNESIVRDGPAKGFSISDLVSAWAGDLLADACLVDGRFPLLIKFLDAQENLSVQVHPKPRADGQRTSGIKHEAWYVLYAEPRARMYLGLADGVGPDELREAANTPRIADLLNARSITAGDCFYLPSGTPHALGGGIIVAEIQTPSDVTYRLYDWDRTGLDGKPRTLHIEQGLLNVRYDVTEGDIVQPRETVVAGGERLLSCEAFNLARVEIERAALMLDDDSRMSIWIVLRGSGCLKSDRFETLVSAGDVMLVPAVCGAGRFEAVGRLELLRVTVGS